MSSELILFMYIVIFLYGIVIGSFLNVCILRVPLKESIAKERSHCMSCGGQLKWYDLVPLFSYLFLGGKCRYCKAKISIQYPLVEAINGLGYMFIFFINGINIASILYSLCFSALLVLAVVDWRTYEIPIGVNIFIGILGIVRLILILLEIEDGNVIEMLIGAVSVAGFLLIIRVASQGKAMGGGDVKLMAAAGLLIGVKEIILALVIGCIVGSIIHIARMKISGEGRVLAMGPYLAIGIFISMLFGKPLINWYLALLGI